MQLSKRLAGAALAGVMLMSSFGAADSLTIVGADTSITASAATVSVGRPTLKTAYSATSNAIRINWTKVSGAAGYRVYRKDNVTKKFTKIKTLYGENVLTYRDSGLSASTRYSYKVKAFKKQSGKTYWGTASSACYATTAPSAKPEIKSAAKSGSAVRVSWQRVTCSGYMLYAYSYDTGTWRLLRKPTASSTSATLYIDADEFGGGLHGYKLRIKAYSTDAAGGSKYTSASESDPCYDMTVLNSAMSQGISRLRGKQGSRNTSYIMYNTQGSKTTKTKQYISGADLAAIERFAAEHFSDSWTPAQKAAYTLNWINKNVTYASGDLYWEIGSCGYAEAIFDKKLGQCLQYNGAMVEMMNYLGYDVSLIWGYRGTSTSNRWQHFWGEITIGSTDYVIEAGNYGESGNWWYLATPYSQAGKYMENGKVLTK